MFSSIGTYNILAEAVLQGRDPFPRGYRYSRIAEFLQDGPDLIGLQEVDKEAVEYLRNVPGYTLYMKEVDYFEVAILSRNPVLQWGCFPIDDAGQRYCLYVRTAKEWFFTTHLHYRWDGPMRMNAMRRIFEFIKDNLGFLEIYYISMDSNMYSTCPYTEHLLSSLREKYYVVPFENEPTTYNYPHVPIQFQGEGEMLDIIISNVRPKYYEIHANWDNEYTLPISDHYAVIAYF